MPGSSEPDFGTAGSAHAGNLMIRVRESAVIPAGEGRVRGSIPRLLYYKEVLHRQLESVIPISRAKQPVRLPVVLDRDEVRLLLARLVGPSRIAALLMYGSGLRLLEALHLRVKDLDFGMGEIVVRRAKGGKDRVTMLPGAAVPELKAHLERVRRVHQRDLAEGGGLVSLPGAYERKSPHAARQWSWQFVFPRPPPLRGRAWGRRRSPSPPPPARVRRPARRQAGRGGCRPHEADHLPQPAALVRHPSAAGRLRYPHGAGAAGASGCGHDDDLYPRPQPRGARSPEPGGPVVSRRGDLQRYRPHSPRLHAIRQTLRTLQRHFDRSFMTVNNHCRVCELRVWRAGLDCDGLLGCGG
jgi:integrase